MGVGAEIKSHCGRCGTTWHVVVAEVNGQVAQVECLECKRRHRARSAGGATPPAARSPSAPKSRAPVAKKPLVTPDLEKPPVDYSMGASYRPGQRVEHPAFGPGVVERVLGATKVQIFFAGGSRVLTQGKD